MTKTNGEKKLLVCQNRFLVLVLSGFIAISGYILFWVVDHVNCMPKEYVHKEQYKDDQKDIKDSLRRIETKLDAHMIGNSK